MFRYCVYYLLFFICFSPEVIFRSRVIGTCPVTTDCVVGISRCEKQQQQLQRLASTQVVSAFGAPGTREYSVMSAFGAASTREYSVISALGTAGIRDYSSHLSVLVLQVLAGTQVISAVGTPGTR